MGVLRGIGRIIVLLVKVIITLLCLGAVLYAAYFACLNTIFPVRVVSGRMIEFAILGPPLLSNQYYTLSAHVYEMVCVPVIVAIALTLFISWVLGYRIEDHWRRLVQDREQQLQQVRRRLDDLEEALRRHYSEYQDFVIRALTAARGEFTEGVSEIVMETRPLPSEERRALVSGDEASKEQAGEGEQQG